VCGCFAVGQHSHQHTVVVSSFLMCEGGGRTGLTELEVCGAGSWTKVHSLAGGIPKFLLLYSYYHYVPESYKRKGVCSFSLVR
jgi:hypothetical protein